MACHCQYEERIRGRELREGFYQNWWNTLRSRKMGCEKDKKVACSTRREAQ